MALLQAKWVNKDSQSLEDSSGALQVKVYASGGLERSANGLQVKALGVTDAMLAGSISFAKLADNANIARLDQTETVAAVWNFGTNLPTVSADPTTANQVCRKSYVDALVNGLSWKDNVRAGSTANLTLSGEQTIDGVACVAGDRVLAKNQTTGSENGIYVVSASGWSRAADLATGADGASVAVRIDEGTTLADTLWFCTSDTSADTVGTDSLTFGQLSGATYTAGDGLALSGSELSVNVGQGIEISGDALTVTLDGSTLSKGASGFKVASAGVTEVELHTSVAGNGLSGGGGSSLALGALTANWDLSGGTYFILAKTPTADGHVATKGYVDGLTGSQREVETFTLDATAITNKYVTLNAAPATANETILMVKGAPHQFYAVDFQMDGTNTDRLTWSSLVLDGVLESGDKLTVLYN
jgi:hypothetical protein